MASAPEPPSPPLPPPVGPTGPRRGWRQVLGQVLRWSLPWAMACGLLGLLITRVPRDELRAAFEAGFHPVLAAWAAVLVAAAFLADAAAFRVAFAATGVACPVSGVALARGATYLLDLVNVAASQGGMGVYLHRAGVGPVRALGTLGFVLAVYIGGLAALGGTGLLLSTVPTPPWARQVVGWLLGAVALYLLLVGWRPRWLARRPLLQPILSAGVGRYLAAVGARLPYQLLLVAGFYVGLRIWGVPLPLRQGFVLLSLVITVASVPLAPGGLGTTQLALVALVTRWAGMPEAATHRSTVLAFALTYHALFLAGHLLIGLVCLVVLLRRRFNPGVCTVVNLAP